MDGLDKDLKLLRDMRERLSAMLIKISADSGLRAGDELVHVTRELTKSLEAEINALEKVIAENRRNVRNGPAMAPSPL